MRPRDERRRQAGRRAGVGIEEHHPRRVDGVEPLLQRPRLARPTGRQRPTGDDPGTRRRGDGRRRVGRLVVDHDHLVDSRGTDHSVQQRPEAGRLVARRDHDGQALRAPAAAARPAAGDERLGRRGADDRRGSGDAAPAREGAPAASPDHPGDDAGAGQHERQAAARVAGSTDEEQPGSGRPGCRDAGTRRGDRRTTCRRSPRQAAPVRAASCSGVMTSLHATRVAQVDAAAGEHVEDARRCSAPASRRMPGGVFTSRNQFSVPGAACDASVTDETHA